MKILGNGKYISFAINNSSQNIPAVGAYTDCLWREDTKICKQTSVIVDYTNDSCEFLIDASSRLGIAYANGAQIHMGASMGGFNMNPPASKQPIICLAGGGGIAGIIPVLKALQNMDADISTYYCERNESMFVTNDFDILKQQGPKLYHVETEGAITTNPHVSIISLLTSLSNSQPIKFLMRPIIYVCGPMAFINKVKSDLVSYHVNDADFRLNF